jgi:hypothetical protein
MNKILLLFIILLLSIAISLFLSGCSLKSLEGYSNYNLENAMGDVPSAETQVLVQDVYPAIGKNQISNETSNDMWWHYPTFQLGSYDQITNHIRYPNNPDEGTCMPGSMCGALYHEKKNMPSNYVTPLPPVNPDAGTRVGYFTTDNQLIDSLPFRTNLQNILY